MPRIAAKQPALFACPTPLAPPAPPQLFTGTSGWAYPTWKPGFYPANIRAKEFLRFYSSQLNSVEVNYTFRAVCEPEQLAGWLGAVPEGFRFSFKAPQRITHFQRLLECEAALKEFFASIAPSRKANKLGVVLFQLPPNFKPDLVRLRGFLALACLRSKTAPRIAFEFRHEGWFHDDTFNLLRSHNAALCIAESDDFKTPEVHTATHRCYRLRCGGGYKPAKLKELAAKFVADAAVAETYAYFKHEDEPTGALNAAAMLQHAVKIAQASA